MQKKSNKRRLPKELGIFKNTLYGWIRANQLGNLDLRAGSQTPQSAMTRNEELIQLRQQVKELEKEKDFLEEASAFFAASRGRGFTALQQANPNRSHFENKHIDRNTEDSIKQRLVAALFKFRFNEHKI